MAPFRLFITGMNGRIGMLLRNVLQNDHDVYGLDRVGPLSDRLLSADVSDYAQVAQVVQQFSP